MINFKDKNIRINKCLFVEEDDIKNRYLIYVKEVNGKEIKGDKLIGRIVYYKIVNEYVFIPSDEAFIYLTVYRESTLESITKFLIEKNKELKNNG